MLMFETIKRIYKNTGNADTVKRAQAKGWITEEEAAQIMGMPKAPGVLPE